MCSHIRLLLLREQESDFSYLIGQLGGKAAVGGFLLISGFSIGTSYLKNKTGYLRRRFLRIYPLYFWAVISAMLLPYLIHTPYEGQTVTWIGAGILTDIGNLFFLQNFAVIATPLNSPLWSISVEVFYYLLLPLLFKFSKFHLYIIIVISMIFFTVTYNWIDYTIYGYPALIFAWVWILGYCMVIGIKNYIILSFIIVAIHCGFLSEYSYGGACQLDNFFSYLFNNSLW